MPSVSRAIRALRRKEYPTYTVALPRPNRYYSAARRRCYGYDRYDPRKSAEMRGYRSLQSSPNTAASPLPSATIPASVGGSAVFPQHRRSEDKVVTFPTCSPEDNQSP